MTNREARIFCESMPHCRYCPIEIYDIEKRSLYEKEIGHVPCYTNLVCHSDWDLDRGNEIDEENEW